MSRKSVCFLGVLALVSVAVGQEVDSKGDTGGWGSGGWGSGGWGGWDGWGWGDTTDNPLINCKLLLNIFFASSENFVYFGKSKGRSTY